MENRLVVNTGKGGRRMGEISEGIKKKKEFCWPFPRFWGGSLWTLGISRVIEESSLLRVGPQIGYGKKWLNMGGWLYQKDNNMIAMLGFWVKWWQPDLQGGEWGGDWVQSCGQWFRDYTYVVKPQHELQTLRFRWGLPSWQYEMYYHTWMCWGVGANDPEDNGNFMLWTLLDLTLCVICLCLVLSCILLL